MTFYRAGFTPRRTIEADDYWPAQGFVAVGLGLALIPQLALGVLRSRLTRHPVALALPRKVPGLYYQEPQARVGLGSDGGSRKAGGPVRSSMLSGEVAAASRRVSGGRFHFCSTSLSTEV